MYAIFFSLLYLYFVFSIYIYIKKKVVSNFRIFTFKNNLLVRKYKYSYLNVNLQLKKKKSIEIKKKNVKKKRNFVSFYCYIIN